MQVILKLALLIKPFGVKTRTRPKHSLSIVFLIIVMITLYVGSHLSGLTASAESNALMSYSGAAQDFTVAKAIQFVVDMVAYSL